MLGNISVKKTVGFEIKLSVKAAISALLVALAVCLPQTVHLIAGASGGAKWLPMYLPVLIGGCLLGVKWGLGIGVFSPIVSFCITAALGNPMPAAARLPFTAAELAVFGAVSGLFSARISENKLLAFPAVLIAQAAGRTAFITLVAIFDAVTPLSVATVWAQIQTGLIAVIAQAVIVPLIVMGLMHLLDKETKSE